MTTNFQPTALAAFALLIIALVYFYRIDSPPLWGDEADTGVEALHILTHGYPIAYDGRNVSIFENGSQLNRDLVCNKIPWTQYYIGALSLLIFGNNTLGLRALFAFIGVLSFFPIYDILRSRVTYPAIIAVLILTAPQVVLFQRNARYYPLLILLYAVLVWHLSRKFKSSRKHLALASLIFVLLFETHPFAAMCTSLSLIAFCLFCRREVLASYSCACGVGFASWFVWSQLLGPSLADTKLPISLIQTNFSQWFAIFGAGLWAAIVDMDAVNCFPILLWVVLLLVLFIRNRDALRKLSQEPLYAFVFLNILIQTVASASIFGYETGAQYALLRYQPHLLVFGLVITFMLLDTVVASKSLYVLAGIFIVTFNFLTLTFWVQPLARSVPSSWLFPVYAEIFSPRENAWDQVIRQLGSESDNTYSSDVPMVTLPPWTQDIAIFYLGDRYLIRPILQDPDTKPMQALRRTIDGQALNSLFGQPEWIVDFLDDLKTAPAGYKIATVIPSHQARPDDGSRPELTRHAFPQPSVVGNVKLFRLQKN